jgi:hypothetical protein
VLTEEIKLNRYNPINRVGAKIDTMIIMPIGVNGRNKID